MKNDRVLRCPEGREESSVLGEFWIAAVTTLGSSGVLLERQEELEGDYGLDLALKPESPISETVRSGALLCCLKPVDQDDPEWSSGGFGHGVKQEGRALLVRHDIQLLAPPPHVNF